MEPDPYPAPASTPTTVQCWNDIRNVHYINLERRADRLQFVREQLDAVGLAPYAQRFNAIPMKNGAIGCTMSHLALLEQAVAEKASHVLILEDDIQFLNPSDIRTYFDQFLEEYRKTAHENEPWDVILLSGNNFPPCVSVNPNGLQIWNCNTTTGYLVNGHYIATLAKNVREGLMLLLRNPTQKPKYAIDIYWKQLQQRDRWFLIVPLTVTQRADYSDIEEQHVNYTPLMLTADKREMLARMQQQQPMRQLFARK